MNILFFGKHGLTPSERKSIKEAVLQALGPSRRKLGELCLIFVDDRKIRGINRQFLGHDYATDVIAFPYDPPGGRRSEETPFGDVYISLSTARRQAKEFKHPVLREIVTLATHGALHLVGYDDRKQADKKKMFARQDRIVGSVLDGKKKKKA